MPRSTRPTWASERRLEWIDDQFAMGRTVHRDHVAAYFGINPSVGSGDMKEYQKRGGQIAQIKWGKDTPKPGYERLPEWQSVMGSTEARCKAWECWG